MELTNVSSYYIKHPRYISLKLSLEYNPKYTKQRNYPNSEFMLTLFHIAGFLVLSFPINIRSPPYTFLCLELF